MSTTIFSVQDRSGTAAQLTTDGTSNPVEVGDTGVYNGLNWEGNEVALNFTVGAVLDANNFCITTITPTGAPGDFLQSAWPKDGYVTWLTGANTVESPSETVITARNFANAYCDVDFFQQYHLSRGNAYPASPVDGIQSAIVQATDYLDQRYRFKGVKLFQWLANPNFDPAIAYIDPWLGDFGFFGGAGFLGGGPGTNFAGWFTSSTTMQQTQWPRLGVVDNNGDNLWGVPQVIQMATAEAALRVLNGTPLQPDYDPSVVKAGAVVASQTEEVGPIKRTRTFDTKLGLSFFPSIPHVDRMLRNAGVLVGGGGRSIVL